MANPPRLIGAPAVRWVVTIRSVPFHTPLWPAIPPEPTDRELVTVSAARLISVVSYTDTFRRVPAEAMKLTAPEKLFPGSFTEILVPPGAVKLASPSISRTPVLVSDAPDSAVRFPPVVTTPRSSAEIS